MDVQKYNSIKKIINPLRGLFVWSNLSQTFLRKTEFL